MTTGDKRYIVSHQNDALGRAEVVLSEVFSPMAVFRNAAHAHMIANVLNDYETMTLELKGFLGTMEMALGHTKDGPSRIALEHKINRIKNMLETR